MWTSLEPGMKGKDVNRRGGGRLLPLILAIRNDVGFRDGECPSTRRVLVTNRTPVENTERDRSIVGPGHQLDRCQESRVDDDAASGVGTTPT